MDAQQMQQALQKLLQVEENKVCADCQEEQRRVTHVSVNNAAFLCSQCAQAHQSALTASLSLVRPLDSDFWSDEQINTLQAGGGNCEFNIFMARFDLSEANCDLHMKYNSVGCQYWRDKLHQMQNSLMPQTEIPTKVQGQVQLDRDVEGDWCLVDVSSARVPSPKRAINLNDNADFETQGQAYLDETEDFRGYRVDDQDALDKVNSFFRRSSTRIKQKWEDTDFKGGASDLGKSIANGSKRTGAKISEGWKEIKVKEKTETVKRGFFRFATKVKGLFSKKDEDKAEPMAQANIEGAAEHEKIKSELKGSDSDDDGEPVPEMLKLHEHNDEEDRKRDEDDLVLEESKDSVVKGHANVVFSKGGVVRDYRQAEKATALDEAEDNSELAQSIPAEQVNDAATQDEQEQEEPLEMPGFGVGLLDLQVKEDEDNDKVNEEPEQAISKESSETPQEEESAEAEPAQQEQVESQIVEESKQEALIIDGDSADENGELEDVADMDEELDELDKEQEQNEIQQAKEQALLYLSQHEQVEENDS